MNTHTSCLLSMCREMDHHTVNFCSWYFPLCVSTKLTRLSTEARVVMCVVMDGVCLKCVFRCVNLMMTHIRSADHDGCEVGRGDDNMDQDLKWL